MASPDSCQRVPRSRGGSVVPELEGELRGLKELSGLAQVLRSLRGRQLSWLPDPRAVTWLALSAWAMTLSLSHDWPAAVRTFGTAAVRSEASARTARAVVAHAIGLGVCTPGL